MEALLFLHGVKDEHVHYHCDERQEPQRDAKKAVVKVRREGRGVVGFQRGSVYHDAPVSLTAPGAEAERPGGGRWTRLHHTASPL